MTDRTTRIGVHKLALEPNNLITWILLACFGALASGAVAFVRLDRTLTQLQVELREWRASDDKRRRHVDRELSDHEGRIRELEVGR